MGDVVVVVVVDGARRDQNNNIVNAPRSNIKLQDHLHQKKSRNRVQYNYYSVFMCSAIILGFFMCSGISIVNGAGADKGGNAPWRMPPAPSDSDTYAPSSFQFPRDEESSNHLHSQEIHSRNRELDSLSPIWLSSSPGEDDVDVLPLNNRRGRVMTGKSENDTNNTSSSRELQQEKPHSREEESSEGSSRKASPDVQDIIDGIVKLLGGKVHNGGGGSPQQPQQIRPLSSPNPTVYNLFNPTKPMFFQQPTPKPTRINNRGPPIPIGAQLPPNNYNQQGQSQGQGGQQGQDNSFEAIPLEALNTDFNLNKNNFGPPFPLNKVNPVDAPYKKGVPLPQQLVPQGHGQNQGQGQIHGPGSYQNGQQPQYQQTYQQSPQLLDRYPPPGQNYGTQRPQQSLSSPPNSNNRLGQHSTHVNFPEGEDDEADELRFTTNPNLIDNNRYARPPQQSLTLEATPSTNYGGYSSPNVPLRGDTPPLSSAGEIQPSLSQGASVYPTLALSTNKDSGFVEIVTKYSPIINPSKSLINPPMAETSRPILFYPKGSTTTTTTDSTKTSSSSSSSSSTPSSTSTAQSSSSTMKQQTLTSSNAPPSHQQQSIHSLPTPPLRPGIVISDSPRPPTMGSGSSGTALVASNSNANGGGQGVGSVEVVTADDGHGQGEGQVGDIFDVTVSAVQGFGGQSTGQPFIVPVNLKDDVITAANGNQQFVSIDGKRTYFNLHPNTALIGQSVSKPTQTVTGTILPVLDIQSPAPVTQIGNTPFGNKNQNQQELKPDPSKNIGVGSVGAPVPLLPQPPGKTLFHSNPNSPSRPVSTSLSISGGGSDKSLTSPGTVNKTPPNIIRRPLTRRPSTPPVRIDTCIVGDDSTCNSDQYEVCRTENGVSSCVCRSGYARRRHREPCKAIISLVLSIKLDKFGDKKLLYNPDYFNPNSETYQSLEWETIHALDSAMSETSLNGGYVGSKLDAIGFDGKHAIVNSTVLMQESKLAPAQLKKELQKQMIQVLTRNRNNFGKSQLWVEGPISAVSAITDLNECEESESNDCHSKAQCINTFGSFECKCESGYGDPFEHDKRKSGRRCDACSGKSYCNGRGECMIDNGQKVCKCSGNYYGSQCDIDGEVLAVAIGASVSAVVIIGLTLACLCMWSRKWKKEEQKAALMSRTLFGGMATQALSYLGGKSTNPYQQHVSMDERLRWAQVAESNMTGNIYVQNDPMSMHTSPAGLMGHQMMDTPPMMTARRSGADTVDTTVDDIFDERQSAGAKRPRSRASQLQGGIYYDPEADAQQDIYASRSMMHFPAQFCVPMSPMGHYAHSNRGFYS